MHVSAEMDALQVRATHAAVSDLDIDIVLCPLLGLETTPFHLAIDTVGIMAQPALEFVCSHR